MTSLKGNISARQEKKKFILMLNVGILTDHEIDTLIQAVWRVMRYINSWTEKQDFMDPFMPFLGLPV